MLNFFICQANAYFKKHNILLQSFGECLYHIELTRIRDVLKQLITYQYLHHKPNYNLPQSVTLKYSSLPYQDQISYEEIKTPIRLDFYNWKYQ